MYGALASTVIDAPESRRSYRTTCRPPCASTAERASGQEHGRAAREQNEQRRRGAEVLDPERDAVRLDRRHHASAVEMTPPDVRIEWTVGDIVKLLQGSCK